MKFECYCCKQKYPMADWVDGGCGICVEEEE